MNKKAQGQRERRRDGGLRERKEKEKEGNFV